MESQYLCNQVKSKSRVANHGEVFTAEREVKAMCDLVGNECERIDARILEPACGNGNFLIEILKRKLEQCNSKYSKNKYDFERFSVFALTGIYGIDLLQDNIEECRMRLFDVWLKNYKNVLKKRPPDEISKTLLFILNRNILCGNALTLMCVDERQLDTDSPIIFTEWSLIEKTLLKRRIFRLDVLLRENPDENCYHNFSMFSDDPMGIENWMTDPNTKEIIPKPIKEYKPVSYKKIYLEVDQ